MMRRRVIGMVRCLVIAGTLGLLTAEFTFTVWLAADRFGHNAAAGVAAEQLLGILLFMAALHPMGPRSCRRLVRALARRRWGRTVLSLLHPPRPGPSDDSRE